MTTPLFSMNAAAEILERDRRTITRALRNVVPDGKQRGADRWRLKTIIDALERLQPTTPSGHGADREGDRLIAAFNAKLAALDDLPQLEARRAHARAFVPAALGEIERHLRDKAERNGDPGVANIIVDNMLVLLSKGLLAPCQWNSDEAWRCVLGPDPEDEAA
jgi:hypothetical protein